MNIAMLMRDGIDVRRLAAIVEGFDDAIVSKTLGGIVTSWNAGAARIFGYQAQEMIGQPITRIVPQELLGEEDRILSRLARGEHIDHFETIRLTKDGRRIEVSVTISPVRDARGRIVGASKLARDISERKRAESALRDANASLEEALRAAEKAKRAKENTVEASPTAMMMVNAAGRIEMVNAQAERLFGYRRDELLGSEVEMLIPERFRAAHPALRRSFFGDPRSRPMGAGRDLFCLRKDGGEFPIEIGLSPMETDEGEGMVLSTIVDISARKRSEEALREANEVAQQARIEAEAANRAKTEFLAVMSHEIRTPLNSISGFINLLAATELTPQQRRYADLVKSASAALLTVVDDILDFSKVEAGQLELERQAFSLGALIHDAVEIVAPIAAAKSLRLNYTVAHDMPQWVVGDQGRLRQILLNLLNNAVKFTESGSLTIDVRKHAAADGQPRLRFAVTDTGIGIAAEQQRRLFKQFSQADSSVSRKYGGTGLGLAICRRLVELMDGEIGIVSEVGRGSTVWFTAVMPEATAPITEAEPEVSFEDVNRAKARILVIDDIDTNLEIVAAFLEESGYEVDCLSNALEAIEVLSATPYDLVLMDIQMPVMDGITATRRIRELAPPVNDIPIIAMTGNVLPRQVRSFFEAGMNDHVGKPIDRAKLCDNVRRWLPAGGGERAGGASLEFDKQTFDQFVRAIGSEKAERIVEKFLVNLAAAFKSTAAEARREAHALINTAGSLGLDNLVEVCRRAADSMSDEASPSARVLLEELRRAQSGARHALTTLLLPKLRKEPLPAVPR